MRDVRAWTRGSGLSSISTIVAEERTQRQVPGPAITRTDALPHMVQLDAVRAFAALGVMAAHFLSYRIAQEGARGVTLFFVLSGFLITVILLKCRQYVERDGQPRLLTLRQFYVRRFLRIFPLYYFVLIVLWLVHDRGARDGMAWHLSYLTNFLIVHNGGQFPDWSVSHFWSLAVEEQFYLVWPWLILFLPRRAIPWAVGAVVCIGPAFRLLGGMLRISGFVLYPMPFFWLDGLGLGALLAIASDPSFKLRWVLPIVRRAALPAGIVGVATALYLTRIGRFPSVENTIYYLGYSLASAWLVAAAAAGFKGAIGRVMTFKPLLWVGAVSYGIYVYHIIVVTYWKKLHVPPAAQVPRALAAVAATFVIAALSFYLYEHPINSLKRYFDYRLKRHASR